MSETTISHPFTPVVEAISQIDGERDIFRFSYKAAGQPLQLGDFQIWQAVDIQTDKNSFCPLHIQECDEISYIVSGHCQVQINGVSFEAVEGDLFFLRKGDIHIYRCDEHDPARICNVGIISLDTHDEILQTIYHTISSLPEPLVLHRQGIVGQLFTRLFEEGANRGVHWIYSSSLLITQMILQIYRGQMEPRMEVYQPERFAASQQALVYRIINHLTANIRDIHALHSLPQVFHYSYSYMSNTFKSLMGVPLSTYFRQRRLSYAADLLDGDLVSITEVAQQMGFQSVHAFSKAFRNHYGMSPTQYLREKTNSGV